MKKLMMFAAAMTIAGSALAVVDVYDYKASVKNVNLKRTTVRLTGNSSSTSVYVKFVQSTTLYGYLVTRCSVCNGLTGDGEGYLVVANKSLKVPKILPADLKAKWWNPKINANKTYEAEGYLFAGRGKDDTPFANDAAPGIYSFGDVFSFAGASTRFLFGTYNDYEYDAAGIPVTFYDSWLDAAGFGKALSDSTDGGCGVGTECTALSTLSGSVIGGLFLCHPNGFNLNITLNKNYEGFLCTSWDGTTDVISGTWSIKRNTKLGWLSPASETAVTLGDPELDGYVNSAAKSIKAGFAFASLIPDDFVTNYGLPVE